LVFCGCVLIKAKRDHPDSTVSPVLEGISSSTDFGGIIAGTICPHLAQRVDPSMRAYNACLWHFGHLRSSAVITHIFLFLLFIECGIMINPQLLFEFPTMLYTRGIEQNPSLDPILFYNQLFPESFFDVFPRSLLSLFLVVYSLR